MLDQWMSLLFETAKLGLEAQNVIGLRLVRLAQGGAVGAAEAQAMVRDKMAAFHEAQHVASVAIMTANTHILSKKTLQIFRKRVRANRRRLSRR